MIQNCHESNIEFACHSHRETFGPHIIPQPVIRIQQIKPKEQILRIDALRKDITQWLVQGRNRVLLPLPLLLMVLGGCHAHVERVVQDMLYDDPAAGAQVRVGSTGADPTEEADKQAELLYEGGACDLSAARVVRTCECRAEEFHA
jgi:hypothetical protein